jgi:hypothetical protein
MGKENKPVPMNPTIKNAIAEKSIAASASKIDSSRPSPPAVYITPFNALHRISAPASP